MRRTLPERALASLAATTFLFAASGHAFALHACPHHDAPAPAGLDRGVHGGGHLHAHETEGATSHLGPSSAVGPGEAGGNPDHHGESSEGDGPCTCVGSCHSTATATAALHLGGARVGPPLAPPVPLDLPGTGLPYAPRLTLYELHQPNAPPPLPRIRAGVSG